MSASAPDPWAPPGFDCNQCGKCCRNFGPGVGVRFLPTDVERIAGHLSLSKREFFTKYLTLHQDKIDDHVFFYFAMEPKTKDCPFVQADESCGIHEVKPEQCVRGPYGILYPKAVAADYDCAKDLVVPNNWNTSRTDTSYVCELIFASEDAAWGFLDT